MTGRPADEQRRYEQIFENDFSLRDVGHPAIRDRIITALVGVVVGYGGLILFGDATTLGEIAIGVVIVAVGAIVALGMVDEIACFAVDRHTCHECRERDERWEPDE